jgi:ATP-binding protein involved in chromosome partitioning
VVSSPDAAVSRSFIEAARRLTAEIQKRESSPAGKPTPAKIGAAGQPSIEIEWSDGKKSVFPARGLRMLCPCAMCVDEVTGARKLDPARVPEDVKALDFYPVGSYALQIRWSDGHDAGLYTYDFLWKLK